VFDPTAFPLPGIRWKRHPAASRWVETPEVDGQPAGVECYAGIAARTTSVGAVRLAFTGHREGVPRHVRFIFRLAWPG
jgi:hypothetical protein